jgi:hypothetical protein
MKGTTTNRISNVIATTIIVVVITIIPALHGGESGFY